MGVNKSFKEKRVVTGTVAAGTYAESFLVYLKGFASLAGAWALAAGHSFTGILTHVGAMIVTGAMTLTGNVNLTGALTASLGIVGKRTVTAKTSAATVTYTAAEVINGIIIEANSEACAATLPAPALIVAAIPSCKVGSSFEFVLKNAASGAYTITLTASGASTIVGTPTVAQNNTKRFLAVVTNITASSEAVVFYSMGTSVH